MDSSPVSEHPDEQVVPIGFDDVPGPAVRRLSLYLRHLENCLAGGQTTISSRDLGTALGVTDAQVRKDLAYFGQFGHRGVGYNIERLIGRIRKILATDRIWDVALVGAGHLGTALMAYRGFAPKGFRIAAVFDVDPAKVGQPIPSLPGRAVQPMTELADTIRRMDIKIGIIAVPADAAQAAADQLAEAGVLGILNFAPVALSPKGKVLINSVDLAVQLEQLSYRVCPEPLSERIAAADIAGV